MKKVIVTGSAGLIGAESVRFFAEKGYGIIGIDNDMRAEFFGEEASTDWQRRQLEDTISDYKHYSADIRDEEAMTKLTLDKGLRVSLVQNGYTVADQYSWQKTAEETQKVYEAVLG